MTVSLELVLVLVDAGFNSHFDFYSCTRYVPEYVDYVWTVLDCIIYFFAHVTSLFHELWLVSLDRDKTCIIQTEPPDSKRFIFKKAKGKTTGDPKGYITNSAEGYQT